MLSLWKESGTWLGADRPVCYSTASFSDTALQLLELGRPTHLCSKEAWQFYGSSESTSWCGERSRFWLLSVCEHSSVAAICCGGALQGSRPWTALFSLLAAEGTTLLPILAACYGAPILGHALLARWGGPGFLAAWSILALLRTVCCNSVELWRKPCIFWYFLEMRYSLFSKDDFTGFPGLLIDR